MRRHSRRASWTRPREARVASGAAGGPSQDTAAPVLPSLSSVTRARVMLRFMMCVGGAGITGAIYQLLSHPPSRPSLREPVIATEDGVEA